MHRGAAPARRTDRACACTRSGSRSSPVGVGVRRLVGMWVCSGTLQRVRSPAPRRRRPDRGTGIDRSVANIVTPRCTRRRRYPDDPSETRSGSSRVRRRRGWDVRRTSRDRDRRRARSRPRARARVRPPGRPGRRQRHRRRARRLGRSTTGPAAEVVDEIRRIGGEAIVNGDDVADWDRRRAPRRAAIDTFGRLDVVVNNAGVVRDRMFVSATEEEWDAVVRVHLKGHFAPAAGRCSTGGTAPRPARRWRPASSTRPRAPG